MHRIRRNSFYDIRRRIPFTVLFYCFWSMSLSQLSHLALSKTAATFSLSHSLPLSVPSWIFSAWLLEDKNFSLYQKGLCYAPALFGPWSMALKCGFFPWQPQTEDPGLLDQNSAREPGTIRVLACKKITRSTEAIYSRERRRLNWRRELFLIKPVPLLNATKSGYSKNMSKFRNSV